MDQREPDAQGNWVFSILENNRLIDPATDVYRDLFVAEHLLVHGVE
jgi:mannose/cellobiose epimerase-like protein (N-acyl-D-glucosamine 2-epimerase family)